MVGAVEGPGTWSFGNGVSVTTAAPAAAILIRYSAAGTAQWAQTTATGSAVFYGLAIDGTGNLYVAGSAVSGTVGFSGGITTTVGGSASNTLLVKYNSAGTAQWAASLASGSDFSEFTGVTLDAAGNLDAVGAGAFDFGGGVNATGTGTLSNLVVTQYSPAGIPLRARSFVSGAGSDGPSFQAVVTDASGGIVAVGNLDDVTYGLGNGVTVAGSDQASGTASNALVVKYTD